MIVAPYVDVWHAVHGTNNNEPTWTGVNNALIRRMFVGCDLREMRLDRMLISSRSSLKPIAIEVACKHEIKPGLNFSDHFALLAKFEFV